MDRKSAAILVLPLILLSVAFFIFPLSDIFFTLPPVKSYLENPPPISGHTSFALSAVAFGFRRFASDIAWIQLLQYVGAAGEEGLTKEEKFLLEYGSSKALFGINFLDDKKVAELKKRIAEKNMPVGKSGTRLADACQNILEGTPRPLYPNLFDLTLRVIRLDPYFKYAYIFSSGALAWNCDRPNEALSILREGIKNNPDYWQFSLYVSAILYKKNFKDEEMLNLLEKAIKHKDAPNIVRVIVANYYEKSGRAADSLKIWLDVVETKDPMYYEKGLEKIEKFSKMLGIAMPVN